MLFSGWVAALLMLLARLARFGGANDVFDVLDVLATVMWKILANFCRGW